MQLADSTIAGLLNHAPIAILVVDEAGVIVVVNNEAERLFGCHRDSVLGTAVESLVCITDTTSQSTSPRLERPGHRPDGTNFSAAVGLSTSMTDIGLLTTATIRDVTERIEVAAEAEGARVEAEAQRVKAALEKEQAERVRLHAEADRVTAAGEKQEAERVRLEAERVRLEVEGDRVTAESDKTKAEGVRLEAEAERGRLEAQLHQSHRMESLGQLAGGVAHDFNNLLAVILNYASFVAEELATATSGPAGVQWAATLKDVEQIQLAAERASVLTHQLLSFARREVIQARPLSLNDAITRMEQILRRTIGEQIELAIELASGLPMVVADPGQIEQIVLNLAINARDAMPDGGILSIETSLRTVTRDHSFTPDAPPGAYVNCRVSDNGIGMSNEVRDRAYEPFFTTKSAGEGSGLGLATVYGIVSQSGGHTRIYSDEGIGTSITITLPAAQNDGSPTDSEKPVQDLRPLTGRETLLVVDDEDALREVTRRILTRNGYTVVTAANGKAAVDIASSRTESIDLRKLRPDIRVLYMSGHALPVLEAEAVLGTDFRLVEKPFDQAMLLEAVRSTLERDE
jgi:PAS domain S-box-containing protein